MKEQVRERRDQRVHSDFVMDLKDALGRSATNQERIDALTAAKIHANRHWLYWSDVRKYIDSQLAVIAYEAQLKLPM